MFTGDRSLNALLESGVLQQQVSLANYTTWRVGGPAQWCPTGMRNEASTSLGGAAICETVAPGKPSAMVSYGDEK